MRPKAIPKRSSYCAAMLLLALAQLAVAQTPGASRLQPNLESNIDRPLGYRPDAGDFVIVNGAETFNRPQSGRSTAFRVDGGAGLARPRAKTPRVLGHHDRTTSRVGAAPVPARAWPCELPLDEAYAAILAGDDLQYHGGGVTHASAYNWWHNVMAAHIAKWIGVDGAPYECEAALIRQAMAEFLWLPEQGMFAEYRDCLGLQRAHPAAALWGFYHVLDATGLASPAEQLGMGRYVKSQLPRLPIRWNYAVLHAPQVNSGFHRDEGLECYVITPGSSGSRPFKRVRMKLRMQGESALVNVGRKDVFSPISQDDPGRRSWPIDQDYFMGDFQFRIAARIPLRVDLKTGQVRQPLEADFKRRGGVVPGGDGAGASAAARQRVTDAHRGRVSERGGGRAHGCDAS